MPLYFFDTYDDGIFMRDAFGIELESSQEARDQAAALLPDMARQMLPVREHQRFAVVVRGADDQPVYGATMTFQGRWWRTDNAGWTVYDETRRMEHGVLATLRGQVLASARTAVERSKTLISSGQKVSLEMQGLIHSTLTAIEKSQATLNI